MVTENIFAELIQQCFLNGVYSSMGNSADRKRGQREGATSKNIKNIFDTFRHFSCRAKIVKRCQSIFRHFSTIFARHHSPTPSGGLWETLNFPEFSGISLERAFGIPEPSFKMKLTCWASMLHTCSYVLGPE